MADTTKPPKGALWTGIILLILALAGCGVGCVSFVGVAKDISDSVTGSSSVAFGDTATLAATSGTAIVLVSGSDVTCEGQEENGGAVTFKDPPAGASGTVDTTDGVSLDFTYSFDTVAGRNYRVRCDGNELSGATGQFAVASFPGFGKLATGGGGVAGGFLFFILGVIFLIIGLVKRSKWKKNHALAGGGYVPPEGGAPPPPAGYVPPPPGGGYTPQAPQAPAPQPPAAPQPPPVPQAPPTPPPMPSQPPAAPTQPPPPSSPPPAPGTPPPPPPPPGAG